MTRLYVASFIENPYQAPQIFEKEIDAERFVQEAGMMGEQWVMNIVDTKPDYPYKLVEYLKGTVELRSQRSYSKYCNTFQYGKAYTWEHSYINRYLNDNQTCDIWYSPQTLNLFAYQKRGRQTIQIIAKDESHFHQILREIESQQRKYLVSDYANFKGFLYDIRKRVKACCRR